MINLSNFFYKSSTRLTIAGYTITSLSTIKELSSNIETKYTPVKVRAIKIVHPQYVVKLVGVNQQARACVKNAWGLGGNKPI